MEITLQNEWNVLRNRYSSKGQYEKRKVIDCPNYEEFCDWLANKKGAEILATPCQSEALRFTLNGKLGIVYTKGSGNLLAHDLGIEFQKYIGDPISNCKASNGNYKFGASA